MLGGKKRGYRGVQETRPGKYHTRSDTNTHTNQSLSIAFEAIYGVAIILCFVQSQSDLAKPPL